MSGTGERVSEERLRQFARKHVRHEGNRSNTTLPSEELQSLSDELLALRQLLRESKPALEAGATALHDAGQFNIKCGQTAHGKFQCDDAVKIRALAHRAGEL